MFIVQTNRRFDNHAAQQIALRAAANGLHAFTAHPEQLTCLRLARYFKIYTTVQRRDFDFTAESSHSEVDRYFTVQIISFTLENGVLLNLNLNIQIACRCAMLAGFTFTCQTNTVAGINARRDFNRQRFRFLDAAMTVTFIARIFDQRTASLTVRTGLLNGEEALAHLNLACPVAGRTGLRLAARFGAAAVTNVALFQSRDTDLFRYTANGFFERKIHVIAQV